ncbi:hypothetical protein FQN60_006187 [Etheostoma spectabile]|uniref:Uncharacterized protein n=1 Tax=Etheostoma spectabile TaxID=54343 RepID=A0A5J5CPK0_9PERO|nr:hypothetical protein FQN60_006187 [Etheostoma spectabile]
MMLWHDERLDPLGVQLRARRKICRRVYSCPWTKPLRDISSWAVESTILFRSCS